jgi:hypothetical protein
MGYDVPAVDGSRGITSGRLVLGVCFGCLLAVAIIGVIYYAAVDIPRQRRAQANARVEAAALTAQMDRDNNEIQLKIDRLEAQVKRDNPGSPCNSLAGGQFVECNKLAGFRAKSKFVTAMKAPKHVTS